MRRLWKWLMEGPFWPTGLVLTFILTVLMAVGGYLLGNSLPGGYGRDVALLCGLCPFLAYLLTMVLFLIGGISLRQPSNHV